MAANKEGDLYGVLTIFGKKFEIYYGYYEEYERNSPYNEPVPVYPDLAKNPEYCDDGYPIVTEMQVVCENYFGKDGEDRCGRCRHFKKAEKLFGKCKCEKRKKIEK